MSNRIILHIDMNSYFASVEQQANPHLRGMPVGVCEHLGGIIIAPSVEAKRLGIRLGTPVWEAQKIFPQIVLLPADPDKYRYITKKFLGILADYSDDVEQYSIDEAFVDITEYCCGDYGEALLLGLAIKQRMRLEVAEWVSCSIGIGPNKLVAKIAADLDGGVIVHNPSPPPLTLRGGVPPLKVRGGEGELLDRICVIRPEEVLQLYNYLALIDVPGIGPRFERALQKLGIFSLRALAEYPLSNLLNQFGINGWVLHSLANFNTITSPFSPPREGARLGEVSGPPKSFGHAYTVPKTLTRIGEIKKLMFKLAEKVGRRMRKAGAQGSVVHYFHSDKQYSGFSKQRQIKEFINDGRDIFKVVWKIFLQEVHPVKSSVLADGRKAAFNGVKIMGISVSGLKFNGSQDFLFEQYRRPLWLVEAMDKINDKYGEYTITRGQMHNAPDEWAKDTVGFSRVRN